MLGNNGRTAHTGATQQLEALAAELASVVRTMDALSRQSRGMRSCSRRGVSASTVLGSKRGAAVPAAAEPPASGRGTGGTPVAGGEVRPAA